MAIELNKRTGLIAGTGLLAISGAAAWLFLVDAPPPRTLVRAPAQVATEKVSETVKPAGELSKGAPESPPLAAGAKPAAAKPIPSDPDSLIAEILDVSGVRRQLEGLQKEPSMARHFIPEPMAAEIAANLKAGYDAERMGRYLELLRQPIMLRMTALETADLAQDKKEELLEGFRRRPPPPAREKLINAIDDVTGSSNLVAAMVTAGARSGMDALMERMRASGRPVTAEMRRQADDQITSLEKNTRYQSRAAMVVTYRDASDEELAEYLKQLDGEIGRWGSLRLVEAMRPPIVKRAIAMTQATVQGERAATKEKPPAADKPAAPRAVAPRAPERPACVFKPVMTDAELAACR